MALGILSASVVLDDPDKVYCGPSDPVSGEVRLKYRQPFNNSKAPLKDELFGPLKLDLHLKGAIRIGYSAALHNISRSAVAFKDSFDDHDKVQLISEITRLHDGPFKAQANEVYSFPFTLYFPEHADPDTRDKISLQVDDNGGRKYVTRRTILPPELLPSSLVVSQRRLHDHYVAAVQYLLDVELEMDGINVNVIGLPTDTLVKYDQPSLPMVSRDSDSLPHNFQVKFNVLSGDPLPQKDRGPGIVGWARAVLKPPEFPTLSFHAKCSNVPRHVRSGQSLAFQLTIREDPHNSTAIPTPVIIIDKINASIESATTVLGKVSKFVQIGQDFDATFSPPGAFAAEQGYTKTIDLGVLDHLPSSFEHSRIQHAYSLRLVIWLHVAGQETVLSRTLPLVVECSEPEVESRRDVGAEIDERLPAYEEAIAGPSEEPAASVDNGVDNWTSKVKM